MVIRTNASKEQHEYLKKLAKQKCRTLSSLIAYAIKRYCTTDGLKEEISGKRVLYP